MFVTLLLLLFLTSRHRVDWPTVTSEYIGNSHSGVNWTFMMSQRWPEYCFAYLCRLSQRTAIYNIVYRGVYRAMCIRTYSLTTLLFILPVPIYSSSRYEIGLGCVFTILKLENLLAKCLKQNALSYSRNSKTECDIRVRLLNQLTDHRLADNHSYHG